MSREVYDRDRLREQWNDATRTYTRWDAAGAIVEQRAYTAAEDAEAVEQTAETLALDNAAFLRGQAATALAGNTAFLAIGAPTNAQTLAQVKLLTKECTALIRLALDLLDSTT